MSRKPAGGRGEVVAEVSGPVILVPTPEMKARGERICWVDDGDVVVPVGARRLARRLRDAGMDVSLSYSLSVIPPGGRRYVGARVNVGGERWETLAVRFGMRGVLRGYAIWTNGSFENGSVIFVDGSPAVIGKSLKAVEAALSGRARADQDH